MRKDRYLKQFTEYLPELRKFTLSAGLAYDDASEVLAQCTETMLKNRKYKTITPGKLKSFLHAQIQFDILEYERVQAKRLGDVARLPDIDSDKIDQNTVLVSEVFDAEVEEQECPFCFAANLNEYGACAMCHTIMPSNVRVQRKRIAFTEESLAVCFDFNTAIDVKKAIARLTPFEQRVVRECGLGHASLGEFALENDLAKSSVGRIWVEAKAKLQEYLYEYAPDGVSKRGENAFRRALQRIEKQREL